MRARDLFGVALRILGVWFLYQAGNVFLFVLIKLNHMATNSTTPVSEDKLFMSFYLCVAAIFLPLADHIVKLAYGPVIVPKSQAE